MAHLAHRAISGAFFSVGEILVLYIQNGVTLLAFSCFEILPFTLRCGENFKKHNLSYNGVITCELITQCDPSYVVATHS